jgi:hypothetical protein
MDAPLPEVANGRQSRFVFTMSSPCAPKDRPNVFFSRRGRWATKALVNLHQNGLGQWQGAHVARPWGWECVAMLARHTYPDHLKVPYTPRCVAEVGGSATPAGGLTGAQDGDARPYRSVKSLAPDQGTRKLGW